MLRPRKTAADRESSATAAAAPVTDHGHTGLVGNAAALLSSRLAKAVLGWLGTVLIARTLDVDEFGRFVLIFTVLGLMSVVTDLGIGRLAVRGMMAGGSDDPGTFAGAYVALRAALGVLGYLIAIAIVAALGYPHDVIVATTVASLVVLVATPSNALDVVFQATMRMGTVATSAIAGTVAQVALVAAIVASGSGTLLLFTIPFVVAELVAITWKFVVVRRVLDLRLNVDLRLWQALAREAVPLSIGFGLATIYYRVDAVLLSRLSSFEAVGVYGVSYKFIDLMHSLSYAVTVPLLAVLVSAWPGDRQAFADAVRRGAALLLFLAGLALVGLIGFAGPMTSTLYGGRYATGAEATRFLATAELLEFGVALAVACLIAAGRHRRYPWVMLAGLAVNVGANLLVIPRWSYTGASVVALGSNGLVFVTLLTLLRGLPGLGPRGWRLLGAMPVALGAALLVGLLADQVLPWVPAAALATVCYLAVAWGLGLVAAVRAPADRAAVRDDATPVDA